ncbi:MAG TPA: porin [Gemmatimonadales bacterium]|nr:porin [Gemmatimonadales bacterium]
MKRVLGALLCVALGLAGSARAQGLTMQMSNGWSFSFAGNVNAFLAYQHLDSTGAVGSPGTAVGTAPTGTSRIRTGLLPAFATFDAKGKEGNFNLGVHFGFAPEIQCDGGVHDCSGAQMDMRQVFLTIGGPWGQILAGRELGVFGRQNILNDQTLFGIGAAGNPLGGGTTLGRIGFGYNYPNFVSQVTYSSRTDRPTVFSIGVFDPSFNGAYTSLQIPRLESEITFSRRQHKFWVGGLMQTNKDIAGNSATAFGLSGGVRLGFNQLSIVGSGFWGKGIGTTFLFANGTGNHSVTGGNDLRTTFGYIGQVAYTPRGSKMTVAASYGANVLKNAQDEQVGGADVFHTENGLVSGGVYYQWTRSLKFVGELDYSWSKETVTNPKKNTSFSPAAGLMLFF